MRPENTEPDGRAYRREAVRSVALHVAVQLVSVVVLLWLRTQTPWEWLDALLLILAAVDLITVPCSAVVLRQRLREIERGELDEAKKY